MARKYAIPEKTTEVAFDNGFTATLRLSPVPMGAYLEIVGIMEDEDARRSVASIRRIAELFGEVGLISWNVDLPPNAAGVLGLDFNVVIGLVVAWISKVGEVSLPEALPSSGISTSAG